MTLHLPTHLCCPFELSFKNLLFLFSSSDPAAQLDVPQLLCLPWDPITHGGYLHCIAADEGDVGRGDSASQGESEAWTMNPTKLCTYKEARVHDRSPNEQVALHLLALLVGIWLWEDRCCQDDVGQPAWQIGEIQMGEHLCLSVSFSLCPLIPTFLFLLLHQSTHFSLAEECPITLFDGSTSLCE